MPQNASVIRHREGLTTRVAGDDVLVLDGDHVAALEGDTARVWNASDGTTIAEVALQTGLSESVVAGCLAQIHDAGLLQAGGLSRRALMARAGLVGAGAAGAVLVTALPAAALTASGATATVTAVPVAAGSVTLSLAGFPATATSATVKFYKTANFSDQLSASPATIALTGGTSAPTMETYSSYTGTIYVQVTSGTTVATTSFTGS